MARKKRNRSGQRDHSSIASLPAARPLVSRPLVSDRRLFHPEQALAPVFSPRRSQRRIVEAVKHAVQRARARPLGRRQKVRFSKREIGTKFAFAVPRKVELCIRRYKRKEVLFALRRTGKGSRAPRRRRNYWTGVSCR